MGPNDELLGVVVHSGLVLADARMSSPRFDGSRPSPAGWSWTPSSWPAASTPKRRADGGMRQPPNVGPRPRPSGRTRRPPSTTARPRPSGKASRRPNGTTRWSRPGSTGVTSPASTRATSCDSGSPPRPVRRGGWTPTSRRARPPRTTIGWKPPTGCRRSPLTACSASSVPGRRSACRRPRPTSSLRTWPSAPLRPSRCGTPPRILTPSLLGTQSCRVASRWWRRHAVPCPDGPGWRGRAGAASRLPAARPGHRGVPSLCHVWQVSITATSAGRRGYPPSSRSLACRARALASSCRSAGRGWPAVTSRATSASRRVEDRAAPRSRSNAA